MNSINVETLKERLDAGETINLLDVRENNERAEFNIGGKHIPLGQIQVYETDDIEDWKDKEVIVYCRSGKRSSMAVMMLQQAGFQNLVNLNGGILAWIEKYGN